MSNIFYCESSYLAHHGVKGMRWGVRRYQDENGVLTNSGRRKYLRDLEKNRRADLKMATKSNKYDFNRRNKAMQDINMKYDKERVSSARNEKEKFKEYKNILARNGLPGSDYDRNAGGYSTKWAKEIRRNEGEEYTNRVMKSFKTETVAGLAVGAAVVIGAEVASYYIRNR